MMVLKGKSKDHHIYAMVARVKVPLFSQIFLYIVILLDEKKISRVHRH